MFSNNDKSISHFERKRRPDICVTENYIKNFIPVTIPGNRNYANISKNGRKILVLGDTHVKRIRRFDFNKEFRYIKAYFGSFSGATSKQLDHYIIPSLIDDKLDADIIHVGTNDILCNANYENISRNIIRIGSNCKSHSASDVFISLILVKKNPLNALIRHVNDMLCDLCVINGFGFIFNDMITTKYLWKDINHLQDLGMSILSKNFIESVNNCIRKMILIQTLIV